MGKNIVYMAGVVSLLVMQFMGDITFPESIFLMAVLYFLSEKE